MKFLGARVHAALADPRDRALLIWPMILGAPKLAADHPEGVPEEVLLGQAEPLLRGMGLADPKAAWEEALARMPETADLGAAGWVAQRAWAPLGALVSLRMGVALIALTGLPEDASYRVAAGVALFNCALFHECHDAFEPLWMEAEEPLKRGLQGLIMLAGGFHHHQLHNARGMISLWQDAQAALPRGEGLLRTPWGPVGFGPALACASARLDWLADYDGEKDLTPLWEFGRPTLELL